MYNRDQAANYINADLQAIHEWSNQWLATFSAPKTKALIFSSKPDKHENATVSLNNTLIDEVQSHKHLGITLSQNLKH